MDSSFARFARVVFPPPNFLGFPTAGIDISTSGIKIARLKETLHGLELEAFGEEPLNLGAVTDGEITDQSAVVAAIKKLAKTHHVHTVNIALPEARGYLFETDVEGDSPAARRSAVESRIDELVPLPPAEVVFDVVSEEKTEKGTHVIGIGYARRVIDTTLAVLEDAGLRVRSIESENFALPRALLSHDSTETVLIIDIGKTTSKLLVVSGRVPRFATTLTIGGHALTLAVQKHFGVTEEEAKKVKAEKGIAPSAGNEEYLSAMLSTVSVLREEIGRRIDYWQTHVGEKQEDLIKRVILVGGNATVRGLPEYLQSTLKLPVEEGNVFINMAKRDDWLPPMDYTASLAYGTAIGLALREYNS
ncbi:MAG: type IV pilus assembly protein PilM [Parcubacteria bacterium C7867-001]|nr:MAG: type IV pilus assembly protein PilM [Parcubacteria bacterium C7867-001]